jgi:hypothetical protein
MRKLSEKHWLAVVIFAVLMAIMDIISGRSAFGATLIYNDNEGSRNIEHIELYEKDYIEMSLAYKEHKIDLANFREPGTWYQFVFEDDAQLWLTEEEGQEMLKYLERMFGWQTW